MDDQTGTSSDDQQNTGKSDGGAPESKNADHKPESNLCSADVIPG
jgi:hypothetical protein